MARTRNQKHLLIGVGAIFLVLLISFGIYTQSQPRRLYPGEVREYKGEKLSSISDIDENAIGGNQILSESNYNLTITGEVNKKQLFTYNEILGKFQLYEKAVTLSCVEGWSATILWEGVLVRDLLDAAETNQTARTVIFHAADGYTTSMPLEYFYDKDILMAHKMNGLVIPPEKGFPFQLVAEDKYGYKWIKWITKIEVSNNENYKGHWESRGYPNDADIP